MGVNAIGDAGYIVFGNKDLCLRTSYGIGLWLNGVILVDRDSMSSRKAAYDKMKFVIENKGNIIIYPEGYWNLYDDGLADSKHQADDHNSISWLIQDFNIGCFKLAKETGASIVPVVLHYDEIGKKMCFSKFGNEYKINQSDDVFEVKDKCIEEMNTIYYDLMEKHSSYKRDDLEKKKNLLEYWAELKRELISACSIPAFGYELNIDKEKLIGKVRNKKSITTNEEAFKHLCNIEYNKNNSYLLKKTLTGLRKQFIVRPF